MSDKWQAINDFWNSFDLPAYDERSVPDDAKMPYITYSASVSNFENPILISASVYYRSTSWTAISNKVDEISAAIGKYFLRKINGGYMFVDRGSPFAQRISDPSDDMVKRVYINLTVEFFTQV